MKLIIRAAGRKPAVPAIEYLFSNGRLTPCGSDDPIPRRIHSAGTL